MNLVLLVTWYQGFHSWHLGIPYCEDHTQIEFGKGIMSLAAFCATGEFKELRKASTLTCPSLPPPSINEPTGLTVTMIQAFVLLHEYGHVILGHLNPSDTTLVEMTNKGAIEVYNISQNQEFAADAFALQAFPFKLEAAYFAGLLFKFFQTSETFLSVHSTTHPPSSARWERIKQVAGVANHSDSLAFQLDETFQSINQWVQI